MPYSATITGFPVTDNPDYKTVQATLVDSDNVGATIVRNYSLPLADNPTPADFETKINADVVIENGKLTASSSIEAEFASANLTIPVQTAQTVDQPDAPAPDQSQPADPAPTPEA